MPSAEHESPIALVRQDPGLAAELLESVFGVQLPAYAKVRTESTDLQQLMPATFHADAVIVHTDADDAAVFAVVFEVQRRWDPQKLRTWPLYVAHLEHDLDVPVSLVIYAPRPAVARRYRNWFARARPPNWPRTGFHGSTLALEPFFVTPADLPMVTDPDEARLHPAQTVLAMLAHGRDPDIRQGFAAAVAAIEAVGQGHLADYYDIVTIGLPAGVQRDWRDYMTTTRVSRYLSEELRTLEANALAEGLEQGLEQGLLKGEAIGIARSVLDVLAARGIPVPDPVREQILATTDRSQLHDWLQQAISADTCDDLAI